jgi:hypothetical protein
VISNTMSEPFAVDRRGTPVAWRVTPARTETTRDGPTMLVARNGENLRIARRRQIDGVDGNFRRR